MEAIGVSSVSEVLKLCNIKDTTVGLEQENILWTINTWIINMLKAEGWRLVKVQKKDVIYKNGGGILVRAV